MTFGVFAIYDQKTGYLTPTFEPNDMTAERNFEHACGNRSSVLWSHPSDFSLRKIGIYDTESGLITALSDGVRTIAEAGPIVSHIKSCEEVR